MGSVQADGHPHEHHGIAATVGISFSLLSLPIHFLLTRQQSIDVAAIVVAVIGAIYVGFALQRGTVRQIAIEVVIATIFFVAALAGLWWNPWVIPVGYAAHGLWDAFHHFQRKSLTPIPVWYPSFCATYDWLYAAGLIYVWKYVVVV